VLWLGKSSSAYVITNLNAARDVTSFYTYPETTPDWVKQRNSSSCLTLIIACIIYWQAKEINRAIQTGEPVPDSVDLSSIEHISPITWDNVILYGEYILDRNLVKV